MYLRILLAILSFALAQQAHAAHNPADSAQAGSDLDKPFYLGVGGYEVCQEGSQVSAYREDCPEPHTPVTELLPTLTPNVNSVTIWITRDWQEHWYSAEQIQTRFIDQGYTPVFIFYWFADEVSPKFVEQNWDAYMEDLARFTRFIEPLKGEKLVILNPEFNQNGIGQYDRFNDLLIDSMQLVRQADDTKVSFCVGDFGDYSLIRDPHNWQHFHPSIARAVKEADFISFQEMRAVTRNSQQDIEKTAYRSLEFAKYLHKTYNKPTFLAYLALSSYGDKGEATQADVIEQISSLLPVFRAQSDLIGFNNFHLVDVPYHVGYFNEAEKNFGLLDKDGQAKGALKAFQSIPKL